jgi:hypothetical protein
MADPQGAISQGSNEGKVGSSRKEVWEIAGTRHESSRAESPVRQQRAGQNLSEDAEYLGIIRRGEPVTVLYRQRSTKKPGEWLGRLVLGYEEGEVRIFAASIF